MNQLFRQIRHVFDNKLPERQQVVAWLISAGVFAIIAFFGHSQVPDDHGFLAYAFGLYLLDSLVFFAFFAERPKLKLVMLTMIFLLEVAAAGFFLLRFVSPR